MTRNTKPATDICTRNTDRAVCPKPENTADSAFLPPVHEPTPDENSEVITSRVLRVTRECYVTLLHTLHSQKKTHALRRKKDSATATGTAAVWLYLVAVVLRPFVEVSR